MCMWCIVSVLSSVCVFGTRGTPGTPGSVSPAPYSRSSGTGCEWETGLCKGLYMTRNTPTWLKPGRSWPPAFPSNGKSESLHVLTQRCRHSGGVWKWGKGHAPHPTSNNTSGIKTRWVCSKLIHTHTVLMRCSTQTLGYGTSAVRGFSTYSISHLRPGIFTHNPLHTHTHAHTCTRTVEMTILATANHCFSQWRKVNPIIHVIIVIMIFVLFSVRGKTRTVSETLNHVSV